jgi:hypothetical protein
MLSHARGLEISIFELKTFVDFDSFFFGGAQR